MKVNQKLSKYLRNQILGSDSWSFNRGTKDAATRDQDTTVNKKGKKGSYTYSEAPMMEKVREIAMP